MIYTDESRKEIPHIGHITGSEVYREHKHTHLSLKVHPYKQGMLNTNNRAELVALLIALRHCKLVKHFYYDLSDYYTHPLRDKFWLQQTIEVQTAEGPVEIRACIRD